MLNINLSKNVVVVEPDPTNLHLAICQALEDARGMLRTHYLPEFDSVPPIEVRISTGRQANNYKNGAHIALHLLSPPQGVSLLGTYVRLLDDILRRPAKAEIPRQMVSELVFGASDKIHRWSSLDHYIIVLRHALKAFFVSLLRQGAVLLPAELDRYMPCERGVWRGFELMPKRLQDMAALYYAGSGLDYGVDWNLCNYSCNGVSMQEKGVECIPARNGKTQLVHLAMCTTWSCIEDIDQSDILTLQDITNTFTIGIYLTYLYLKSDNKDLAARKVFKWVETIPRLRIYVDEYSTYTNREKSRRSNKKRLKSGLVREAQFTKRCNIDRRSFKERLDEIITLCTSHGKIDAILLAQSLGRMKGRSTLRPNLLPKESVLPDSIDFDWARQVAHWLDAFRLYVRMSNYSDEDQDLIAFAPFMHYLSVYLPIYFHENIDSDASFPTRVEAFNGFYFISRPFDAPSLNLPLPYGTFVKNYYSESLPISVNTAMRKLYRFFELILGRRELLGIPSDFKNPVLETDIPGTGGRPTKSTKTKLPRKAYWLSLLYAYKIYDYISIINQKCLEDAFYASEYSILFHNLDADELGMIDIRDLLEDNEVDRVIKFEDKDYVVNFVPSYFFSPVNLPLKNMGERFLIRPHSITHLICTLETGIRNQHIQWLSYDFDKHIHDKDINAEDVYQLFVMTDKSNTSWTALTAGRVIKILREMRIFRDLIDAEEFDKKIYYEGRKEKARYSPFKVLFAFNLDNGNPYSDNVYETGFKYIMTGVQHALDYYGVEFEVFEVDESKDPSNYTRSYRIKPKLSPHSMRVTVVSEYVQFLNSEFVGRYITNQKLATVWYYTKYDAEELQKMQAEQKRGLSQFSRETSEVRLIGNGGTTIDATDPNSTLVKGFKENPDQAIADFGAVSSHFFDRETGIGIVTSNRRLTLAFEPTHICPYNRICPTDRYKDRLANRCNFCDYAIRTVEHLPALGCRRRDLVEELERLEAYQEENADRLTEGQDRDIDERISVISVDIGCLDLAEKILQENLRRLKSGQEAQTMVYMPEAILKNLEAVPFPDPKDETRYLLARLAEIQSIPDDTRHLLRMKFLNLAYDIRANTGNIREMLKRGSNVNRIEADVFSLVNSLKTAYGLSIDQIAEIATRDVREMVELDHQAPLALPFDEISTLTVFSGRGEG